MPAGFTAKAYRNTGTFGVPIWDEVPNVRDCTVNNSHTDIDASTRGGGGFMEHLEGLKDASVDFQMLWDTADVDFTAIQTAYNTRALIDMAFMDGNIAVAGSQGLHAEFAVINFTRNEPLDDAMSVDVSLKPKKGANPPEWLVIP